MSTILETALISRGSSTGSPNLLASHAGIFRGVVFLWFSSSSSPVCRPSSLSLGPGSALGEEEKIIGGGEKNRGVRFARRYFSYLTPFFAFYELPQCENWSQPSVCILLAFKMAAAINIPLSFLLKRWSVSGGFAF